MKFELEVYGERLKKLEKLVEAKNLALKEKGMEPNWTLESMADAILNLAIDDKFSNL